MTKRVSIKGQGAEIFFDKPDPTNNERPGISSIDENRAARGRPLPAPESKPARETADNHASKQDSLPASQQASSSRQKAALSSLDDATRRRLLHLIEREHRTHNTYRYHPEELAAVRDIVYELEVRWGVKVARNDVMRAAIIWATEDYKERGEESFLVRLFREGD